MIRPIALIAGLALGCGQFAHGADARARELIEAYHLQYLPGESGYYGQVSVSNTDIIAAGKARKAHSSIYYLLTREAPVNYLHRLEPDDVHVLLEGGPVEYLIFHPGGKAERRVLGRDLKAGQSLMISIPGGCWKALRLMPGAPYALMANVLSPQWTPDSVQIGAGPPFIRQYTGRAPWASADLLRALIGPTFHEVE
jgi:predicted cupin superfamily sugar epimerase